MLRCLMTGRLLGMTPVVPVIGSGQERVQALAVADAGAVAAAAIDEPAAANRVFELGSRPPLTMDEILRTIMRVLGKQKPLIHQPAWLVKIPAAKQRVTDRR